MNRCLTFATAFLVAAFVLAAGRSLCETIDAANDPGPAAADVDELPPPELWEVDVVPEPPTAKANEVAWSKWLAACLHGDAEHQTFSQRRVDVMTDKLAIEVEWCLQSKVHESVRQATYYGVATGRKPAIVLLVGRGNYAEERRVYDQVVELAAQRGVVAVSVLDVNGPDLPRCIDHLGLTPTPAP